MGQTNIDLLFNVTAPVAERSLGTTSRIGDLRPAFGDHLHQASGVNGYGGVAAAREPSPRQVGRQQASKPAANDSPARSGSDASAGSVAASQSGEQRRAESATGRSGTDENTAADVEDGEASTERTQAPDAVEGDDESADEAPSDQLEDAEVAAIDAAAAADSGLAIDALSSGTSNKAKKTVQDIDSETTNTAPAEDQEKTSPSSEASRATRVAKESLIDSAGEQTAKTTATPNDAAARKNAAELAEGAKFAKLNAANSADGTPDSHENGEARATAQPKAEGEAATTNVAATQTSAAEALAAKNRPGGQHAPSAKSRFTERTNSRPAERRDLAPAPPNADAASQDAAQAADALTEASHDGGKDIGKSTVAKGEGLAASVGRTQPGGTAAHRSGRTKADDSLPRVDAARFVGRVAKAFHTAQERGGTLQLRLSPPELGSLRLELTVKDGVMTAALETETASARRLLLDHLPALRDRLAEQNIRVERFDVDVRREGGGQADHRPAQQQQDPNHREQAASRAVQAQTKPRTNALAQVEVSAIQHTIGDTGINLVV